MKTCSKCGVEKDVVDFNYDGMSIDLLSSVCKDCKSGSVKPVVKKPVVKKPVVESVAPVVDATTASVIPASEVTPLEPPKE